MDKAKTAKEGWIEEVIAWGVKQVESKSMPDAEALGREIEILKNGFNDKQLSEEDANRYGSMVIHSILILALASNDIKIMSIALILKKMDAPVWAGPIAAKLIQAGLEQTPKAKQAASDTADWFGDKWSRAQLAVKEYKHAHHEQEQAKMQMTFDLNPPSTFRKSKG